MNPIDVHFTLSRHNEPLIVIEDSPLSGLDVACSPQSLRKVAALLVSIADDSEALGLNPGEQRRSYPVGE